MAHDESHIGNNTYSTEYECPNCGMNETDYDGYCVHCGESVVFYEDSIETSTVTNAGHKKTKHIGKQKRGVSKFLLIPILVIVLLLFFSCSSSKSENHETSSVESAHSNETDADARNEIDGQMTPGEGTKEDSANDNNSADLLRVSELSSNEVCYQFGDEDSGNSYLRIGIVPTEGDYSIDTSLTVFDKDDELINRCKGSFSLVGSILRGLDSGKKFQISVVGTDLDNIDSSTISLFYTEEPDGKISIMSSNADGSSPGYNEAPDWIRDEKYDGKLSDEEHQWILDCFTDYPNRIANYKEASTSRVPQAYHASKGGGKLEDGETIPDSLRLLKEYVYLRSNSDARYFIVVENVSSDDIRLEGTVLLEDNNGHIVDMAEEIVNAVAPGQISVLGFYLDNIDDDVRDMKYSLKAEKCEYNKPCINDLEIESSAHEDRVYVRITNNGDTPAECVSPYTLFFKDGTIISHEYSGYEEIEPNQTKTIELECFDGEFDDYELYITAWNH